MQHVEAAMVQLRDLSELASRSEDFAAAGQLLSAVNVNLFFRFGEQKWGKRKVRRVTSGTLTIGAQPHPVQVYDGRTDHRSVKISVVDTVKPAGESELPDAMNKKQTSPLLGEDSLGNVHRSDKTPVELFCVLCSEMRVLSGLLYRPS